MWVKYQAGERCETRGSYAPNRAVESSCIMHHARFTLLYICYSMVRCGSPLFALRPEGPRRQTGCQVATCVLPSS
ncbi:hypothetical protein BGY98DRAFT_994853 [Russula aff. rugulosa BPL654]|nr:hypothetical protein BGY98DRAFT_994853 [Russula aff. rugulosa BPL654]